MAYPNGILGEMDTTIREADGPLVSSVQRQLAYNHLAALNADFDTQYDDGLIEWDDDIVVPAEPAHPVRTYAQRAAARG